MTRLLTNVWLLLLLLMRSRSTGAVLNYGPQGSSQPPSKLNISMPACSLAPIPAVDDGAPRNSVEVTSPSLTEAVGRGESLLADALATVCGTLQGSTSLGGRLQTGHVLGARRASALESALVAAHVLPQDSTAPRELGEGDAGVCLHDAWGVLACDMGCACMGRGACLHEHGQHAVTHLMVSMMRVALPCAFG